MLEVVAEVGVPAQPSLEAGISFGHDEVLFELLARVLGASVFFPPRDEHLVRLDEHLDLLGRLLPQVDGDLARVCQDQAEPDLHRYPTVDTNSDH